MTRSFFNSIATLLLVTIGPFLPVLALGLVFEAL
jgi:hypothetical protein